MKVKVALLQMKEYPNDQDKNLIKGIEFCRKAKVMDADIVLFPEMWNNGYAPYHKEVWDMNYNPQNPKYPELIRPWQQQAITKESEYIQTFCSLAKELDLAIAITYMEKWSGNPRNSVSLINRYGDIIITYAKVHTCDFSLEYQLTPGDGFYVADLDTKHGKIKLGVMICFDREFPESARVLMLKGAEIILIPNSCDMNLIRTSTVMVRAYENMVGIALTNYAGAGEGMGKSVAFDGMPYDLKGKLRDSMIVQAGKYEGIYIAEFDIDAIRKFRSKETQGNAFRKPRYYSEIISTEVNEPFKRTTAKRRENYK